MGRVSQLGERVRRQTVIVVLVMGLAWGLQAGAAGQRLVDHTNADPSFFYVKLGYSRQFSKIGATSFGVDYFYGSDRAVNDDEAQSVGAGLVQKVDPLGTELYVGLRCYDLDRNGVNLDSVVAVLVGARIKF